MDNSFTPAYRNKLVRLVFLFILASFIFRYYNHVLLHQLLQPVVFKTDADFAYWLYHIAGLPRLIVQNQTGSVLFDCLLISLAITTIVYPFQRATVIAFSILYPLYFLSYNAYVTHHTGTLNGILLITCAFWATRASTFRLLWDGLRYFTIAIYAMAFFWKVFIGVSVFHVGQAEAIVKENLALNLYLNPDTLFAACIYWFLQHPVWLYIGYSFCILLQGAMVIGFFTKKYDRLLCILIVFFHLATYFFVDVCYFELLILNFTFFQSESLRIFKEGSLRSYNPRNFFGQRKHLLVKK